MAEGKLREVEQDAMRNAAKHFRDQEETLQYEALKSKGVEVKTPEQVLSEVQKTTSPDVSKQPVELVTGETNGEEVATPEKPLDKMNKTELKAVADSKGVVVEDGATNKEIVAAIQASEGEE